MEKKMLLYLALDLWISIIMGCSTTHPERSIESPASSVITPKEQQSYYPSQIYHQTEDHIWKWVHETKTEEEFKQDAISCRGTPEVIDAYLSENEKEFMPLWMLPSAAFNKCMYSKGWTIEKQGRTSEP